MLTVFEVWTEMQELRRVDVGFVSILGLVQEKIQGVEASKS
jgi:hypothetical protein